MIYIKNTQRKIMIPKDRVKDWVNIMLGLLKYSHFDISIWFTTNKTIQAYNNQFRHKDKPTDILSFPFYPELRPNQRIKALNKDEQNLGDLILSAEYIQHEADKLKVSFDDRLKLLLAHGICHLLGYDHIEDKDYRQMRAKEEWLLKHLS